MGASFEEVPEWACAHFLFLGCFLRRVTRTLTRVRDGRRQRVARSYGLEIFDVQLRRESIGTVLRVMIDRPDRGVPEKLEERSASRTASASART